MILWSPTHLSTALGLEDRNNFVSVDLWEASNLKQVATNIVGMKRLLGFGYEKGAGSLVVQLL